MIAVFRAPQARTLPLDDASLEDLRQPWRGHFELEAATGSIGGETDAGRNSDAAAIAGAFRSWDRAAHQRAMHRFPKIVRR